MKTATEVMMETIKGIPPYRVMPDAPMSRKDKRSAKIMDKKYGKEHYSKAGKKGMEKRWKKVKLSQESERGK